jgi:hypothetical protein
LSNTNCPRSCQPDDSRRQNGFTHTIEHIGPAKEHSPK